MSKRKQSHRVINQKPQHQQPIYESMLDEMIDEKEYQSIIGKQFKIDFSTELSRALDDISKIRGRPVACLVSNMINHKITVNTGISEEDDLPFGEMLNNASASNSLDIVLITPGGSGQQVAKFVDKLRPRFENVSFILPAAAMSAGTMLVTSGDEIIMTANSYIGPTDPQVLSKDGRKYLPIQAIITLIQRIQNEGQRLLEQGQQPAWADLRILDQIDPNEIGFALTSSEYSVNMVKQFLHQYKFKTWTHRASTGEPVTNEMKLTRADEIARTLCDHNKWLSHSMGISRELAWDRVQLKITHSEQIAGLDRAIRRLNALLQWVFENTAIYKIYALGDYMVYRYDQSLMTAGK